MLKKVSKRILGGLVMTKYEKCMIIIGIIGLILEILKIHFGL